MVFDEEVKCVMVLVFNCFKIVLESGGVVLLVVVFFYGGVVVMDMVIVVIIGGNVDFVFFV